MLKISKNIFFTTLFLLSTILSVFSQEDIIVQVKTKKFSQGEAPAFIVEIPQASFKQVEKSWEKLLKSDTREKTENINGEIIIRNKVYEKIVADTLTIYSYIKEYDGVVLLYAFFQVNNDYISRDFREEVYYPTKKYIRDFAVEEYKEAVRDELKEEEKELKKLERELESLINDEENLRKEISAWERDILSEKDAITLNEMDQSDKVLQIQAQKELILKLANAVGEEQDEAEKTLKQMEKDFKKLQRQHEKSYKNIDDMEAYIRSNENAIEDNLKEQKFIKLDLEDQEYKVRKIEKKLENIE